jgi:hypothetical protein
LFGLSKTNTIGYYDDLVAKMLDCGNPEKMGYLEKRPDTLLKMAVSTGQCPGLQSDLIP